MKNLDNKGITLIELIVVIAISTIVIGSAAFIIKYSSRNYRGTNEELSLQKEAQVIIKKLNELIMEANNVKYQDDQLTIFHKDHRYIVTLNPYQKELIYKKVGNLGEIIGEEEILSNHVEEFDVVDTGEGDSNNLIEINMELKYNHNSYDVENYIITIRNPIKPID